MTILVLGAYRQLRVYTLKPENPAKPLSHFDSFKEGICERERYKKTDRIRALLTLREFCIAAS